jgi:hypothetical protein
MFLWRNEPLINRDSFVIAAATFFCTYEIVKSSALWLPNVPTPYIHMAAASIGELVIFCEVVLC